MATVDPSGGVTRLGAYRLHGVLGEGGMGVVHLGVDESGRAVAVKVLRDHVAHDPVARARLAREVATLRRVDHPAIAPFLGADVDGDRPYIVTRYIGGDPLDKWVAAHGPLRGEELREFGVTLAEALEAIHAAGIVHRDLKPGNVLMPGGSPVVIDFGIAQVADETRLTSTGLIMGTPGYVAPELLDGHEVSIATDLWGYAATLAFAATGRPPFGLGHSSAVLDRVHRGAADLGGLVPRLRDLLQRALDPEASHRPALAEMRETLTDRTLELTPPESPAAESSATEAIATPSGARETTDVPTIRSEGPRTETLPAVVPVTEPVPRHAAAAGAVPPRARASSHEAAERRAREDVATAVNPVVSTRVMPAVPAPPARRPEPRYARFEEGPQWQPQPQVWQQGPPPQQPPAPGGAYAMHPGQPGQPGQMMPYGPGQGPMPQQPGYAPIPRRVGTMLALAVLMVALTTYMPGVGLIAGLGWSWLARFVDRVVSSVTMRRAARGVRDRDVPMAVLASPLHLLGSGLSAVVAGILPLFVGLGIGVGLNAFSGSVEGLPAATSTIVGISVAAALVVAWWGPGGTTLRRGSRSIARGVAPGRPGGVAAVVVLLLAAAALGLLTQSSGWSLSWWPLDDWLAAIPFVEGL